MRDLNPSRFFTSTDEPPEIVEDEQFIPMVDRSKEKIRLRVFSVEMMISKCKKLSFVKDMLGANESDFGFKKCLKDFEICFVQEVIDQVYKGQPSPTFWREQQKLQTRLSDFVVRSLHATLFKIQPDKDRELLEKVDQLQWVTPEQFGVPQNGKRKHPKLWDVAQRHLT